jgi:hypothetical protein
MNIVVDTQIVMHPQVPQGQLGATDRLSMVLGLVGRGLIFCSIIPLVPVVALMHLIAMLEPEQAN